MSTDDREAAILSPLATRSRFAIREQPDDDSSTRSPFQRDRDRIIHSKAFRRLMHKTQVFIRPAGDHVRTRLTHTLEVSQIARTIGRALGLNEDLIEAIGMGHDLGHTPFGHSGERALASVMPGFRHNEQSLRVVDKLERNGQGLNLTEQVRDGILRHSKTRSSIFDNVSGVPSTLEGQVMKIADGVAYLNHDLDDAIRAGMIAEQDVPYDVRVELGERHSTRINTLVADIVAHSDVTTAPGRIAMSVPIGQAANALREFLFGAVYDPINLLAETIEAERVVTSLYYHFLRHPEEMRHSILHAAADDSVERKVTDYVASMTDRFALDLHQRLLTVCEDAIPGLGTVPWPGMP
jgi:dGTPase